jgi:hypothetical protein
MTGPVSRQDPEWAALKAEVEAAAAEYRAALSAFEAAVGAESTKKWLDAWGRLDSANDALWMYGVRHRDRA